MNEFDPKIAEGLLSENKIEEAKQYIEQFVRKSMTPEERAQIHVDFTLVYLKVMNEWQEAKNKALRELLEDLKVVKHEEKQVGEQLKLANVRDSLK
jgi:hypothetical protein